MKLLIFLSVASLALAQQTFSGSAALDAQMQQAIDSGLIPGGVVLIGHAGKIVHFKAYGQRALVPAREAMTADTIFDLASLTKVVATTPAIMKLFEQGKIHLNDLVTVYLPEFQGGKSDITVRDLLTHFSGLRPDLDLVPAWTGYETGIHKALIDKPTYPPGERFLYSDINFELLGEIVRRLSGQTLDKFVREQVYAPLGMRDTGYLPAESLRPRIAPTEVDAATGKPWRGIVHDPTSRYMGGVAGHAGVFSTASDLARYCEMLLGMGEREGVRIFAPATVEKFTEAATPPDQPVLRSPGWDIDSSYSSARGELFPIGSYGHLGFTGTSIWIDPASKTYVILLTNYIHPKSGKNLSPLRRSISTIAAAALGVGSAGVNETGYNETLEASGARRMIAPNHRVLTGLDVLEDQKFAPLQGKHVGLITNQTGLDRSGRRNVDAMRAAGVNVVALYAPEHGLTGKEDRPDIGNGEDSATGLPVFSLYDNGKYRITPEMLRGVDTLVFDIQDAGARFYTYSCTMLYALDQSAKSSLPFYVLDRPNPVTGVHVEGPLLDPALESFVGCYALPIRHGLTLGELATMANVEKKLGADLHVIKMKDWNRGDWFDSTDLIWTNPSPNLRGVNAATLYPGVAMLESAPNLSVGRGTDVPFEQIGADWIHGAELAQALNARSLPGVRVYATRFQPTDSVFKGKTIEGVRFVIVNRETFSAVRLGLELAFALQRLYPGKLDLEACRLSIGNRKVLDAMKAGTDPGTIEAHIADDLTAFAARRKPFLLY
ncbi:MAG TPA: exo-beta-N-acetylmuramidase NamZ domain-containing protein [Bryobacteraceae bacterium]|jgi:uncharacterized protein YbbC (DUF1343 family)